MNNTKQIATAKLPKPIIQTEIIKVEDDQLSLQKLIHCIGPNTAPLIDWKEYELTSYSHYKPKAELKNTHIKKQEQKVENKQAKILESSNKRLLKYGVKPSDRGIANQETIDALNNSIPTNIKEEQNFGTKDIKHSKLNGRINKYLGKTQLKLATWFHLKDLNAVALRNLEVADIQLKK